MISLDESKLFNSEISSSKGNQFKWKENDYWYKADRNGYEGASEYIVSKLLEKSTLSNNEFLSYSLEQIQYKNQIYNGCKSKNFLKKNSKIITLERLYRNVYGKSLTSVLTEFDDYNAKAEYLVNEIKNITGLNGFGEYLYKTMVVDALFLNEDRHMHNIALIVNDDSTYEYCPIFDNGASLLSDIKIDYPLNNNVIDMIKTVKSKTLGPDFIEAINQIEELYGTKINFYFTDDDINEVTDNCSIYNEDIRKRIKQILKYQRNKMEYYF